MSRIIAFDVNETLLDLKALDAHFERVFRAVGAAALDMTAAVRNVLLTRDDRNAILGAVRELPPHPEVPDSLRRLREVGLRLCALTNSTQAVAEAQLGHAGLAPYFERILSADTVRRLKPHAAVYHVAARECGVEPGALRLVAVHSWDVAGAARRLGGGLCRPPRGWCPIPFLGSQTSWVPTSLR